MPDIRLEKRNKTIKIVNRNGNIRLSKDGKSIRISDKKEDIRLSHTGKTGPMGPSSLVVDDDEPTSTDVLWLDTDEDLTGNYYVPIGGTTNQVLKKISDTDFDTGWSDSVVSVAGKSGAVTLSKSDVGLNNVDNTSDANKPVSAATQSALDGKAPSSHTHISSNITDLDTAISTNTVVAANAAARHTHANTTALNAVSGVNTGDQDLSNLATKSEVASGLSTKSNTSHVHDDRYYTESEIDSSLSGKQDTLVSGTDIKTINGSPILGSGDLSIPGTGDVVGPSSSVNNHVVTFNGTTGKIIKDSGLTLSGTNTGDQDLSGLVSKTTTVNGKPLSSNVALTQDDVVNGTSYRQFSAAEKTKLSGIATGAEVNVNADWNASSGDAQILNKPTFGTAALKNIPEDGNASVTQVVYGTDTRLSDARTPKTHTHAQSDIINLTSDLSNKVTGNTAIAGASKTKITYDSKGLVTDGADATTADIADTINKRYVTDAEKTIIGNTSGTNTGDQDLSGFATTTSVNAALSSKANTTHSHQTTDISGFDEAVEDKIGTKIAAGSNITVNYDDGTGITTIASTASGSVVSVNGEIGIVTLDKTDIGLGNVDNTSDTDKPVSAATQTALGGKADSSHTHATSDVTGLDTALSGKLASNAAITGATKTKITYDAKGLVTAGSDATTADIADSLDRRYVTDVQQTIINNTSGTNTGDQDLSGYSLTSHSHTGVYAPALGDDENYVTDAEKVVIGNTSGTNTGDNATNTQYSGLAASKQDVLVSGTNIKTVNNTSLLGTGNITITGGGASYYDIVVDTGGTGDYLTVDEALTAATAGQTIFIKSGTYTVASSITVDTANLSIIGENKDTVRINLATSYPIYFNGANVYIRDLWIDTTGSPITFASLNGLVENCKLTKLVNQGSNFIMMDANYMTIDKCYIKSTSGSGRGIFFSNSYRYGMTIKNSYLESGALGAQFIYFGAGYEHRIENNYIKTATGGSSSVIFLQFDRHTIANNTIVGAGVAGQIAIEITSSNNQIEVRGNVVYLYPTGIRASSSTTLVIADNRLYLSATTNTKAFDLVGSFTQAQIINNNVYISGANSGTYGFYFGNSVSGSSFITGNVIQGAGYGAAFRFDTGAVGSVITNNVTSIPGKFAEQSAANLYNMTVMNNTNAPILWQIENISSKNVSGASIGLGSVVVRSSTLGNIDDITTTTTAGDSNVLGIANQTIANNAYGNVQTSGKTMQLKVNGTTDIAIGDYLSTYTEAGIAAKAQTGHTAFAIALEAYTVDDSAGIIDALIISPRII